MAAHVALQAFTRLRWPSPCTSGRSMTTIGQLIEVLYAKYERQLHDHELAAAATQRALERILSKRSRTSPYRFK